MPALGQWPLLVPVSRWLVNRSAGTNPIGYQEVRARHSRRASWLWLLGLKSRFNASRGTTH